MQVSRWKTILIIFLCLAGFAYSLPNVLSEATRAALPGWVPHKAMNLGLDLRGGAHLLYEIDVDVVFKDRSDSYLQDLRTELRKEKIGYTNIGTILRGVRVTLREESDGEAARKILRGFGGVFDITTEGSTIQAVLSEAAVKQIFDQTISQSIEIVRRRVDELGTTEPIIQRQGDNRILIQAPGANAEELKGIIGTTAKLNFHLVQEPGENSATGKILPFVENPGETINVQRRAIITGDMLENAQPSFDQSNQPVISFRLNNSGARRFCDISRDNVGKPFAIVLDDEVISAPVIREAICGGQGQISGGFTVEEANNLALLLRAGALPAPMSVVEERTVGPSLGADSIAAGKVASLIGAVLILIFMTVAYGSFGMVANAGLLINVALMVALLSSLQATLTLPGIAGIVLTMGMAVDANVLIFERVREEIAAGRSPFPAIDAGYKNAMTTIVDSNLTTFIAAIILFAYGTGPIKGFAVTLGIGLVTSFFSAIVVTKLMIAIWLRWRKPKSIAL